MRVFLAEKPSVGREISKYLPGKARMHDGYIEHGDDVVTWAFGHMLQQAEPGDYDEKYKRWNANDLPIVPKKWKLLITKSSAKQFKIIKNLLEKADTIVHAGDPDREGQLLIDEILVYLNINKPVERILINALDEKSMKEALGDLRNNEDFFNLRQSALARARADWLIGMNLSRAYTLAIRNKGYKVTFPIGRVKTPTLALIVRREEELEAFKPVTYYTVQGIYEHKNGKFKANWKPKDTQAGLDADNHLLKKEIAEKLVQKLLASPQGKVIKCERKKRREYQRLPLSLSALQVLAGKAYGYDPQEVLETAQSLYEKKLTTYPRSDCDYLPQSQFKDGKIIIANLQNIGETKISEWANGADIKIKSKAWNDKKITAHHAIIPTTVKCPWGKLSPKEKNIYRIISKAYIAQFYPVHQFNQTHIELDHLGELFVANGRVVTDVGWKVLYGMNVDESDDAADELASGELPLMKKGDGVIGKEYDIQEKETKPPSRFTAATLLQAMKEIHKYVKNDEVKKQLKDVSGIGTEATRATIIDDLIKRGFIEAKGKKKILTPTENAYLLIHSLPDELSYPDETAFWEERLAQMTHGNDTLESFINDQIGFLSKLVQKALSDSKNAKGGSNNPLCPSCKEGRLVRRKGKFGEFYGCSAFPKCKYTQQLKATTTINKSSKAVNVKTSKPDKNYKCPRCSDGYFCLRTQGNRQSWICSNSPKCRTTCADLNGMPSIYANRK